MRWRARSLLALHGRIVENGRTRPGTRERMQATAPILIAGVIAAGFAQGALAQTAPGIETVTVIGTSNFDVGEFQIQHGKLDNITVAWGTGLLKGNEALLVASKDEKAEIKLSLAYANQKP